jgi:hypothetical protein
MKARRKEMPFALRKKTEVSEQSDVVVYIHALV